MSVLPSSRPPLADMPFPAAGTRRFGAVNWLGVWTLYKKEVMRFLKVGTQTVLAPIANVILFYFIFTQVFGASRGPVGGVDYGVFIAPGLVMMNLLQNAFANTSSSLIISKVQGSSVDFLMPPLSPWELTFCFVAGGVTRGLAVAATGLVALVAFGVDLMPDHLWAVLLFGIGASMLLSSIGVIAGIWADKFDHLATVTNFIIIPLSMLSGTFYSIDMLGGIWADISAWNPFFYLIDGFRYGFIGTADASLVIGASITVGINMVLLIVIRTLFARGYRLKA